MDRVSIALANATQTKDLRLGSGVLREAGDVFAAQFPGCRPFIVCDANTWEAAGKRLSELTGWTEKYMFPHKEFHAEWEYVEELEAVLGAAGDDAVAVAVGSGTINDLCKLVSEHLGRRYMTVATAASMDGYTSFGASITKDGNKQTFPCKAPKAVVADVDIIAGAPSVMTAAGFADLFAKVPAGADWIIADALGIEPIDPLAFGIVQDGLKDALSDPEGARNGDPVAIRRLTEGLLLGGFAMQAYPKSSRPASGCEHQFSHLWNMRHHVMEDGTTPSHGFQVSIGSLTSLYYYDQFMKAEKSSIDIDAAVAAWPSLEDQQAEALRRYAGTDFPRIGYNEITAKYCSPEELRSQLQTLLDNWDAIKERLSAQIVTPEEAKRRLALVGAPVEPEQIGLTKKQLEADVLDAQHIRRRFTILDLTVRTGKYAEWTRNIFE